MGRSHGKPSARRRDLRRRCNGTPSGAGRCPIWSPLFGRTLKLARIATAQADRDAKIEQESARSAKEEKRFGVNTEIADAEKHLSLKKAATRKQADVADAEAVKAGEMEMKLQDIRIAEREVERQKLELNATVRERADAERYEVEQTAAAQRRRREEAALALKAEGFANAEARAAEEREVGLAEAESLQHRRWFLGRLRFVSERSMSDPDSTFEQLLGLLAARKSLASKLGLLARNWPTVQRLTHDERKRLAADLEKVLEAAPSRAAGRRLGNRAARPGIQCGT